MSKSEDWGFGIFAALVVLLGLAFNIAVVYIVIHFVLKYW